MNCFSQRTKRFIPQPLVRIFIGITVSLLILAGLSSKLPFANAEDLDTSVTVGNSKPVISGNAAENPASTDASPTNVGSDVTFQATATDPNGEDYYLAVCKTDSITPNNSGAPTCAADQTICVSGATTSGDQATCSYTTLSGDSENTAWYAFVCDGSSAAECSTANQGTGDSGSPFAVNHAPTFAAITNDSPKNPGQSVTWSTSVGTTDADSGASDTVKLIVCKTTGITGNDCDGGASDRWCASGFVANNPSCSYAIPAPGATGTNDAYVYLVDSHNFPATGGNQGSNVGFSVSNASPVVSAVSLNSDSAIDLTEGTTKDVTIAATVTDNNGCLDLTGGSSAITAYAYRSGVGYATNCDGAGDADGDSCYPVVTCSLGGANTCDGASDASASYTCTVSFQYYADPTDTNTTYEAENWLATVKAVDSSGASGNAESAGGADINSLTAMNVDAAINYGTLTVGQMADGDTMSTTTTVTATGNVGLDERLSGTDMTAGLNTIAVDQQHYALTATTYTLGVGLSTGPIEVELNVPKTTSAGVATGDTYWGIQIPLNTLPGAYTGTNTISALKGEYADW